MKSKSNGYDKYPLPCLLYDSECTMCTRFKQALERIPGADSITKVSIHNNEIYTYFPSLDPAQCNQEVHLIDEDENILSGAEVITYLAKKFPGVKKIAWLLETNVGKKSLDYFYKMVSKYRNSSLNKCPSCKDKNKKMY